MTLERIAANPRDRDPASERMLREYARFLTPRFGGDLPNLLGPPEPRLSYGELRGDLWSTGDALPSGIALWDLVPGVGRRVRLFLGEGHRTSEDLARLLVELEEQSDRDGPIASVVDSLPGVPREVEEETFPLRGFFRVERLVFRLPPEASVPDETLAGRTDLRPLEAGDEAALVHLMREAYDQLAGESAPWLFHRDPRQDARDAVREILEGRRGEWLPGASFGVEVAGALRGASLVTRLEVPLLCEVMVAPPFRGIGLGTSLAFESVRTLREREEGELHTVVASHDLRALKLCARLGFEPVDRPALGLWVNRVAVGVPPPPPG